MKYEHEQGVREKVSTPSQQTLMKNNPGYKETVKSYSDVVKSLPHVVEVVGQHDSALKVVNEYRVESPEVNVEVIPTPPLVTEENLRFSLRNVQSKLERVEDKAAAAAKKRNMEGNTMKPNSFDALSDPVLILRAIKMGVLIPDDHFTCIIIRHEIDDGRENMLNKQNVDTAD